MLADDVIHSSMYFSGKYRINALDWRKVIAVIFKYIFKADYSNNVNIFGSKPLFVPCDFVDNHHNAVLNEVTPRMSPNGSRHSLKIILIL